MDVLDGPNTKQMERIASNLDENQERFENNLRLFEEWIKCQPHLPKNYDRGFLTYYLRGTKHSLDKAKQKFEKYFILKNNFPEFYADRDPNTKNILNVTRCVNIVYLPKLTADGDRVSVFKLTESDPALFDIKECLKLVLMIADLRMSQEYPHTGEIYIFDGGNMSGAHSAKLFSSWMRKVIFLAREVYPIRVKHVHIINAPPLVETLVNGVKTFMHEKFKNRFMVHKNLESLYKQVPRDILPAELGGKEKTLQELMDDWHQCLIKNTEWFQKQETIKATGAIPNNLYQSYQNVNCGIEGSFRQLAVD